MADQAFNITKGRTTELAWRVKNNDPATSGRTRRRLLRSSSSTRSGSSVPMVPSPWDRARAPARFRDLLVPPNDAVFPQPKRN